MSATSISTTRAVERCERLAKLGPAPAWWRVFAVRRWLRAYRAIMALDISVHAEMLRTLYTPDWVAEMANRANNTLRRFIKPPDDQRHPRRWIDPVTYEDP